MGVPSSPGRAFRPAMNTRWLALLAAAGAGVLTGAGPVHASCGVLGSPPTLTAEIEAAKVAFVGSVVNTSDGNRSARVKVESIWKGPTIPAYVDVHGEAPGSGPFSGSEGDHRYQPGERYLFLPLNDRPPFDDYGDCNSSTQVYDAAMTAYAPPDARAPELATPADAVGNFAFQYSTPASIAVLSLAALIWVGLVKRRRRARVGRP